jgi:hypothetical protein
MAIKDLHNNMSVVRTIAPVAVGVTGTGVAGKPVDTFGFQGVEIIASYGAIVSAAAVFTLTVKEGDATGAMTSVADTDLIGSEVTAGIPAAARVDGTTMNVTKRVGYIGTKRYVSASIKSTATAGTPVSADVVLARPANAPVA